MTALEFIRANGLTADEADFSHWVEDFKSEMSAGLAGEESSLRMIPTYLSAERLPKSGAPVIVLDAGGTNLRIALMEFVPGQGPTETYFQTVPMLGTQGRLSIEEFYERLAELVAPLAEKSDHIGFCFSFPCEILPSLDGRVILFDKEVDITGAEGSILGEGLAEAMKARGLAPLHMVVINDTVAAMLGAMAQGVGGEGAYMGFILGTGTNICASFPNAAITKVPGLCTRPGSTVINLESGGFDKLARSAVDRAFDATTANPGDQVLEKLISGAYQGPMILAYLKAAADAGVFSGAAGEKLTALEALSAKEVSGFLSGEEGPLSFLAGADREAALAILDAFFRRAARLTAATLAAVLDATDQAGDPARPVNIAAEGTTFYKCPLLHKYLLTDMQDLAAGKLGLYSRFVQGSNPNLTGSALAALAE